MPQPDARRAAPRQESGSQKIAATTPLTTITAIADRTEQRRRVRLRRDLNRLADRLTPYDPPAAALARSWAREVA
jgi:hypothetical protein